MSTSYSKQGNIVNSAVLALSLLYALCVVYRPTWRSDGFCIQNKHVYYWSSFDTCLYVDVFFSAVIGVLYMKWRKIPGMEKASELIPMVIVGTLGHGLAHGFMARSFRMGLEKQTPPDRELWQYILFAIVFWFPLLKASLYEFASWKVACVAAAVTYLGMSLKDEHGFAYVQTILAIAFHSSQLLSTNKNFREYLTLPLFGALPPLIVAWNEALFCEAYFKSLGGHMLYDLSIIVCFIGYYVESYWHVTKVKPKQE